MGWPKNTGRSTIMSPLKFFEDHGFKAESDPPHCFCVLWEEKGNYFVTVGKKCSIPIFKIV